MEQSTALDPRAAIVGRRAAQKKGVELSGPPSPEGSHPVKPRYLWISDDEEYVCAFVNRSCRGAFCTAWLPHPEHDGLGRCMRLPALPEEE